MKIYRLQYASLAAFVFLLVSCATVPNTTPSSIGILPLESYQPAAVSLSSDTSYQVIQSEPAFNQAFSSTGTGARKPAFNGQLVVAILLKQPVTSPVRYQRADVTGNTINIYASTCSTADCPATQAILATIPRVGNATQARFFINDVEKAVVRL